MTTTTIPAPAHLFHDKTAVATPTRTGVARFDTRRSIAGDYLFRWRALAPVWLVLRIWLGYEWFHAGWEKLHTAAPGGWFDRAPSLVGFVQGADAVWAKRAAAYGHPNVHYAWFLNFLHFVGNHAWFFGPVVVISEVAIGLGLMTGIFTRWAALGAIGLNLMYVMGGSAGVNGVFLAGAVLLVVGWRVAGELGGDGLIRRRFATAQ